VTAARAAADGRHRGRDGSADAGRDGTAAMARPPAGAQFSFFVTSLAAMRKLSGSQDGFGGDLRHGERPGLAGADKICTEIAEWPCPAPGPRSWRAFLSTVAAAHGGPRARHRAHRRGPLVRPAGPPRRRQQGRPRSDAARAAPTRPSSTISPTRRHPQPHRRRPRLHRQHAAPTTTTPSPAPTPGHAAEHEPATHLQRLDELGTSGRPWCGHSWPARAAASTGCPRSPRAAAPPA
jgi:hypothetical protein